MNYKLLKATQEKVDKDYEEEKKQARLQRKEEEKNLRLKAHNLDEIREDNSSDTSEKEDVKESPEIMNQEEIQKLKERFKNAKIENRESPPFNNEILNTVPEPVPPSHHRAAPIHEVIENLNPPPEMPSEIRIHEVVNYPDPSGDLNNREETLFNFDKDTPFLPNRENSLNDREEMNEDHPLSPKFSNENNKVNESSEIGEDLKINRMLVGNIETLESEVSKAHKRINYLENYNNQLLKSKNELYEEKEDLIKRSIEFEYVQKRLEEKERRIAEIEKENSIKGKEILSLRKDNGNLRHQMQSLTEFIKKIAVTRAMKKGKEEDENEANYEDLAQAVDIFSNQLRSSSKNNYMSPEKSSRNNGFDQLAQTAPMERNHHNLAFETEPTHKIVKKRYKNSKSKKKRLARLEKTNSPISKDQLKLLHDPQAFEKYSKELDLEALRFIYSEGKKTKK